MTELWVKDKHGEARDIILGYDDNVRTSVNISQPFSLCNQELEVNPPLY